jgi:hypothetical protein
VINSTTGRPTNPWTTQPGAPAPPEPASQTPLVPASGPDRPQPATVTPPDGHLSVRQIPPLQYEAGPRWWWLGCHGGAGVSTLTAALPGSADAWRAWPTSSAPDIFRVVLVARTHAAGLQAARAAAQQWASGAVPRIELVGLVLVADAPGRLPRVLRDIAQLVRGGVPRTWELPWVEALRQGGPPSRDRVPAAFTRLATDLQALTATPIKGRGNHA